MLILIVAGGPDKGRIYELFDDREVVIGRDGADLQFNDVKVSRRHARVWCDGGKWYLQDLDSKHGTHRNHKEIDDVQPLKDGDYIQVGRTVMVLARMSAEHLEQAALQLPMATANRMSLLEKIKTRPLVAAASIAAVLLLGVNAYSFINASRSDIQLKDQLAAAIDDQARSGRELQGEVRLALESKTQHERNVESMIAAFGPKTDRLLPKLDTILATLDAQPDVAGPLTALAQAIDSRDNEDQIDAKIDSALAMLRERGGEAEALAEQFREMLSQQPTMEQLAAVSMDSTKETRDLLGRISDQLDNAVSGGGLLAEGSTLAGELAELRRVIETNTSGDTATAELQPLIKDVLARVDALDRSGDSEVLLAAIADVKSSLPADPSEAFAAVNAQLASLTEELNDRRDSELIQQQLAQLIQASEDADAAALAAANDPLLGQLLDQVSAISSAQEEKLDAIIASLERQPYDNRAMLDEALAQLGGSDAATPEAVAGLLDQTMAELRGKSITDAGQLRRMIQREVVAAVGRANGDAVERLREDVRLTKTETAYKLAFETGKPIAIGVARDPLTGKRTAGRTLDPADAVAAGHQSWRDWYLMDDLAYRMQVRDEAQLVTGDRRPQDDRVLSMPGSEKDDVPVNVNASPVR
ncbi:MAG: FHA domain-containing protein [Planctomycetota bacterium]